MTMILPVPLFANAAEIDRPAAMMQVGPNPSQRQESPLPIPRRRTIIENAPAKGAPAERQGNMTSERLGACLAKAQIDPAAGLAAARDWLAQAKSPDERVRARQCVGMVLSQQGDFAGAENEFASAIAGLDATQAASQQGLLAMAGNAALAGGNAAKAVDWLDRARALGPQGDNLALAAIEVDRGRALVALGRMEDAVKALGEAHRLAPNEPTGWLLSATLYRRMGELELAQRDIEMAASLDPRDPAIGLEAGVIAVLSGRDEAARKSWQSVIATAPQGDEAKTAKGYLEQLGPAPTSAARPQG